jgi:hypothetical protein
MTAALVIEQEALREHFFYQNRQLLLERVELPESIVRPCRLIFSPITAYFCATRRRLSYCFEKIFYDIRRFVYFFCVTLRCFASKIDVTVENCRETRLLLQSLCAACGTKFSAEEALSPDKGDTHHELEPIACGGRCHPSLRL